MSEATRGKREAEAVLHRSERLEALGTLSPGIVHELNDLLTVVLGSHEQLRRELNSEHGRDLLERADQGVRQVGRLARQLLAFAGRERHGEARVELNQHLAAMNGLLGKVVKDGVTVLVEPAAGPAVARLDAGQLELALLTLLRRAADAMPGGGRIVVRVLAHAADAADGRVEIAVQGEGMGENLSLPMVRGFTTAAGGELRAGTAAGGDGAIRLIFPMA